MADFHQHNRPLRVILGDVPADAVLLTGFSGAETISRLYVFTLTLAAPADDPFTFADALGKSAVVQIDQGNGQTRFVHGIVNRLSQGHRDREFTHFRAELVPMLWLLTRTTRSRLFQNKTVREILTEVLGPVYTPDFRLEGTYHPRNICAQYRETDFAFASRLMEEEGMYYYFTHSADGHTLVVSDNPRGHANTPEGTTLEYQDAGQASPNEGRVTRWAKAQELRTGSVDLSDHCFEMPPNDLRAIGFPLDAAKAGTVTHDLGLGGMDKAAVVEHPGGYAHWRDGIASGGGDRAADLDPLGEESARIAGVRMDQIQTTAVRIDGGGTYYRMTAGHKFSLADHFDADGDYVTVSVRHDAVCGVNESGEPDSFRYHNEFECLPFDLPFRPQRETPRPVVKGTQTAVVVGDDPEIDPDKYGRVKVWFRWDPEGQRGLESSCWVRVAQFWAGRQWGAQFLPRVGDEVVVAFLEGDPDQPLIIGSVYNADNMPLYTLPEHKTQSGIKTTSYPGGTTENFNELRFEDKKGHELIHIHAERNMTTTIEASETVVVGANSSTTVANNQTVVVGTDAKADPHTHGKSTTTVFGDTAFTVTKGDYSFSVAEGKSVTQVKGPVTATYGDLWQVTAKLGIKLESATKSIELVGAESIKLSSGASSVELKKDGTINIKGVNVTVEGSASVKVTGAKVDVEASALATIKGALVKINC